MARKIRKPYLLVIVSGIVTMLLVITGTVIITRKHAVNPVIADFTAAQKTVIFPLFVPGSLPNGYSYLNHSISTKSNIVVFVISGPGGQRVAVTEQSKPSGFDFSQLSGTSEFNTPLGNAYVDDLDLRTTGSVVGSQTWLIINTTPAIGESLMSQIINSFQPLK